mgnify:CR=1 FL=1
MPITGTIVYKDGCLVFSSNTKNVNNTNRNNTKYSVEYQNKNHVRFKIKNNNNTNNGNIISKNKLLQAKYFNNLNNINNNNTYMEIHDFNKILPYLQNINNDLPDNNKDLFYLFGISYFLDFTKLTNKIFDKIIDNINNIQWRQECLRKYKILINLNGK